MRWLCACVGNSIGNVVGQVCGNDVGTSRANRARDMVEMCVVTML